jgi:6-phosphogluconolactonase
LTPLVYPDAEELAEAVAVVLVDRLTSIQAAGRTPMVVLAGGGIIGAVYRRIEAGVVDWTNVEFWWGDERFVPEGHEDRNDRLARQTFLDRLNVPAEHIHPMPAHGCDLAMAEAADAYAAALPDGPFDIVLLGIGVDGHVASLFPGFEQSDRAVVEVFDSPKPPAQRITMSLSRLNHARAVWVVAAGAEKAEAVDRVHTLQGTVTQVPARGLRGTEETIFWLDAEAAAELPEITL